jgi:subtilisin family serine protease
MFKRLFFSFFFLSNVHAVTVAVIDTGFDLDHEALKPQLRLGETDEEGAIALPGFDGWKFTNNEHLKIPALDNAAVQEVLQYRSLKARAHQAGLTPEERDWLELRRTDKAFKERLKIFKRHTHGTLVTGILLSEGEGLEVFPVRGLGIDVPTLVVEATPENASPLLRHTEAEFRRQVKLSEERIIRKMSKMLKWIHHHNIRIVNASYGVTETHIRRRFQEWHQEITGLTMEPILLNEIVESYFRSLYRRADRILSRYPDTLYIFSAGNLAQDNDAHHHFPSRIRRENVISVAAVANTELASFSNWGKFHVDIAAPGVAVASTLPSVYAPAAGSLETVASGTSMAAPHVANLAARCLVINEKLKAHEIKRLIMETGQSLVALESKTVSGRKVDAGALLKACTDTITTPLSSLSPDPVTVAPDNSSPPASTAQSDPPPVDVAPTQTSP